ncbi:hypothetical protein [Neorhodopirellula lusitana]|uniref:hypothetical protein n=1 Tax=Neorhodopirellula lusitana TaxID=445327 RepID=UPI0024B70A29|nr:hypothetical protein [Neorhodopirellula lusitana]
MSRAEAVRPVAVLRWDWWAEPVVEAGQAMRRLIQRPSTLLVGVSRRPEQRDA